MSDRMVPAGAPVSSSAGPASVAVGLANRTGSTSPAAHWRAFTTAVRLGWLMEANWTDPLLFFIYSVAKPLATTLILVFMVLVIGGASNPQFRAFVVVGSALWSFVVAGIAGLAWSILDDRERYRMLKYVYVSPSSFAVMLVGRGAARITIGAMGAVITLAVGVLFLGVPLDPARIDWPLLAITMVLGMVAILAIGILLASTILQTRQESWSYPEAVAGALFLVVGAVFPLAVLPPAIQAVGLVTPLTWWLAGVRHALFPDSISSVGGPGSLFDQMTGHAAPQSGEIVVALLLTGALVTLVTGIVFRAAQRRVKERGLIDMTTGS
jgi:ABC-2 type transport system permease protein